MNSTHTHRTRRTGAIRRFAAVLAAAPILAIAVPAVADACTVDQAATTRAFAQYGDAASYTLVPGGAFTASTTGWTLTDAALTDTPDSVGAPADSGSLQIDAGGSAVSPAICIDRAMPTFRFMARPVGDSPATMTVNLLWRDAAGGLHSRSVGTVSSSTGAWAPSSVLPLATAVPLSETGGTQSVQMEFVPDAAGPAWDIDDVYADPYARGFLGISGAAPGSNFDAELAALEASWGY